jgi:BirA family transcriptional regulator, biotin operon repressor / biotin---[acetyl-CoA-carboxylase] ligase
MTRHPSEDRPPQHDRLHSGRIYNGLKTNFVGRTIFLFSRLESTNRTAMKIAKPSTSRPDRTPDGTLILAETQTQGRGRLGRKWISPPDVNLYASFILFPSVPASHVPIVTCLAATSIVKAVESVARIQASIKWPNDILIGEKKVAGILTELVLEKDQVNYLVIGMGINVNLTLDLLPREIRPNATSIRQERGQPLSRDKLASAICNALEERYVKWLKGETAPILDEFRAVSTTLGKKVKAFTPGRIIEGRAETIDSRGNLILKTDQGTCETIHSGDLVHLRNSESCDVACH